jgi:hypothetical protein
MRRRHVVSLSAAFLGLLLLPWLSSGAAPGSARLREGTQAKPQQTQRTKKPPSAKMAEPWPDAAKLAARRKEAEGLKLFQQAEPLAFTLAADFKAVNRDRDLNSTKTFAGVLTVKSQEGGSADVPLQVTLQTRGNIRLKSTLCSFVPLRIEFAKESVDKTVFDGQSKLKLITHCDENPAFDQYVLLEYLAYRLYNVMTPRSFRVRPARATYVDSKTGKTLSTHNAVFIEDERDLARRMEGREVALPRLEFKDFDQDALTLMAVFQYMIGNTDYSIYALHNVHQVQTPAKAFYPIIWDFDITGLVDPRYGVPNQQLRDEIASVRKRLYRGPCRTVEEFEPTLAAFRAKQADVLALVGSIPGLSDSQRQKATDYLGEFFTTLGRKDLIKRELVDKCRSQPTM